MLDELSMDAPMTRREAVTLMAILQSTEDLWLPMDKYRRNVIGLGPTQFWKLKKEGRFIKGTHPATLGFRKQLIHRYFNMYAQRIIYPGVYSEPITRKQRGKNGKKDKEGNAGRAGKRVRREPPANHSQGRTGNEAGQHMPGSKELPQA